jgi:DNA-binding LytR/AlgR family response regulator
MEGAFVWTDESTLVNLDSVAYIRIEEQEARIVFSNGEKIIVGAQHLPGFREYLKKQFRQEAKPAMGRSASV